MLHALLHIFCFVFEQKRASGGKWKSLKPITLLTGGRGKKGRYFIVIYSPDLSIWTVKKNILHEWTALSNKQ